jgi:hypothetical protein
LANRSTIILILFSLLASANSGSNYSAFGIGDIQSNPNSGFQAMGGTAVAFPSETLVNLSNPAMWTYLTQTSTQLGYQFNQTITGADGQNVYQTNSSPNNFSLSFVMDTANGISVGAGLYKYTNTAFATIQSSSNTFDGLQVDGFNLQSGEGGINRAYIGGSVKVLKHLSLGLFYSYSFGSIDQISFTNYASSDQSDKLQDDKSYLTGTAFRIGAYYQFNNFGIGGFYETAANLNLEQEQRNFLSNNSLFRDSSTTNRNVEIPASLGFGINYQFKKYRIGADYITQDFGGFNLRNINNRATFDNYTKFSFGIERFGSKRSGANIIDRTILRAGLGYEDQYYNLFGEDITDIYASFGFTTPITASSFLDYSIQIGSRGVETNQLVQETYFKMNFNIRITEEWFKPFRKSFDDVE